MRTRKSERERREEEAAEHPCDCCTACIREKHRKRERERERDREKDRDRRKENDRDPEREK